MNNTKWKVSTKKTITWKEGIDCNINDTGISENPLAFGFVISFKTHKFSKTSFQRYGFQHPIHQINSNI